MYGQLRISAKDISHNKNARKRRERTALRFDQFKSLQHVSDDIYRHGFEVDGKEVVFLSDFSSAKWIVSECDDYIIGSGVVRKCFDIKP